MESRNIQSFLGSPQQYADHWNWNDILDYDFAAVMADKTEYVQTEANVAEISKS